MKLLPVVYLLIIVLARLTAAYDPKQLVRGYLVIPNPTAAKMLISQQDPLLGGIKNAKKNRNKMSFLGLGFYIFCALIFLLHAVLFLLEPMGPADYTVDTRLLYLHADTLNEAIILTSAMLELALGGAAYLINSLGIAFRRPAEAGQKLIIVLTLLFSTMFLLLAVSDLADLIRLIRQL